MASGTLTPEPAIIDTDSHLLELGDVWTDRLPKRVHEQVPRIERDSSGSQMWVVGSSARRLHPDTSFGPAGWHEWPPARPDSIELCDPAAYSASDRLRRMDEYGIKAQVLYPNIVGFHSRVLLEELGPELATQCTRAYNDFLTEWCSADPDRLLAISAIPWWDPAESAAEIERCAQAGHRGILFSVDWERIGLPPITDSHWSPVLATAQAANMSLNLHIGFGNQGQEELAQNAAAFKPDSLVETMREVSLGFISSTRHVANIATSGVCDQYPELNFVIVESGVGWMPFLMEALDWTWQMSGLHLKRPERELPSFYIRRQIYGTFWFESHIETVAELLPDNLMFETDFPHGVSLTPGPASIAKKPRDHVAESLGGLPADVTRKLLHDNAARIYRVR